MPHPTNLKQRSKKASEAKKQKNSINIIKNFDDSDNASYDEAVENNDATDYNNNLFAQLKNNNAEGIVKKLQESANKYYREYDSNKTHSTSYLGNSVHTKRKKRQQQHEAAKRTSILHTF
ncbi:19729_t:CDS:2 [Gigaspora rosea]|nr:19729_t:CDS:2 [Gigaspora rosea]